MQKGAVRHKKGFFLCRTLCRFLQLIQAVNQIVDRTTFARKMSGNIHQAIERTVKMTAAQLLYNVRNGLFPGILGKGMLQNASLMKLGHIVVKVGREAFYAVLGHRRGLLRLGGGDLRLKPVFGLQSTDFPNRDFLCLQLLQQIGTHFI